MSEYWKSTPKYWCKHCSIYVKDTPFERKQHEITGKHQGNLKRFLRGIQNDHERNERDKQKVKDEVERLNRVVAGSSTTATPAPTTAKPVAARSAAGATLTAADQKRQWAQLAEMGIAVPETFRGEMAIPGDWQTIAQEVSAEADPQETFSKGVRKRKLDEHEVDEEGPNESTASRGWGRSMRKYPGQAQEEDLDMLLNKPISKKEKTVKDEARLDGEADTIDTAKQTTDEDANDEQNGGNLQPKEDNNLVDVRAGSDVAIKVEAGVQDALPPNEPEQPTLPIFKKRKAKGK